VERDAGSAPGTVSGHLKLVARYFELMGRRLIQFPTRNEYANLATSLGTNGQQEILYIDGVIIGTQRGDNMGDAGYCGRKACDGINGQVIVDKRGRIRHVISGCLASMHDVAATRLSPEFMAFLQQLPHPYYVVDDSGYLGLSQKVVVPFTLTAAQQRNPANAHMVAFNKQLSKQRVVVEHVIGALECKFRLLQLKENRIAAKTGIEFPSQCLLAAAVLHNLYTNYI
jgi:hypothetical protein